MKRFRFRLLSLMMVVAMIALAVWRYELRRRSAESAEFASVMRRRSAEFASKANQHRKKIIVFQVNFNAGISFSTGEVPVFPDLTETPQDSERGLRYLEHFYGDELTESDLAQRGLTKRDQVSQMLYLLWLRYEVYMYFKYRRAATMPWLPVDPDPPLPPLGPHPPPDREWWRDAELQRKIAEYRKTFPNRVPE